MLMEVIELIMGVIVNCEEKQLQIQKILTLDEKTQEDLQNLIERSLHRLSIELTEASVITDNTTHQELVHNVERLEKEKRLLREKILELENEVKVEKKSAKTKDDQIKQLTDQLSMISMERDLKSSRSDLNFSSVNEISELEGQIKFKDQSINDLNMEIQHQKERYKQKIAQLKDELEISKERLMKIQKNDA